MASTMTTYLFHNAILLFGILDTVITNHGIWSLVGILYLSGLPIAGLYNAYCIPQSIREMKYNNKTIGTIDVTGEIFVELLLTLAWIVIVPVSVINCCLRLIMKFSLRDSVYTPPKEYTTADLEPTEHDLDSTSPSKSQHGKVITDYSKGDMGYMGYISNDVYCLTECDIKTLNTTCEYPVSIQLKTKPNIRNFTCIDVRSGNRKLTFGTDWDFIKPGLLRFHQCAFDKPVIGQSVNVKVVRFSMDD